MLDNYIHEKMNKAFKRGYAKGYRTAKAKPMWTGLEKMAYQKGWRAGDKHGYNRRLGDQLKYIGQTELKAQEQVLKDFPNLRGGHLGQTRIK